MMKDIDRKWWKVFYTAFEGSYNTEVAADAADEAVRLFQARRGDVGDVDPPAVLPALRNHAKLSFACLEEQADDDNGCGNKVRLCDVPRFMQGRHSWEEWAKIMPQLYELRQNNVPFSKIAKRINKTPHATRQAYKKHFGGLK